MNTSRAIAAFLKAVAGLPKADLAKLSADLNDSIPEHLLRDQFNADPSVLAAETAIGPREAASGGGAATMTARYSDPAPQNELTALVSQFGKRLDATEETIKAQTALIRAVLRGLHALSKGEAFPSDSIGANGGSEEGEESDKRRPANEANDLEADEASKGRLPVFDIASMFDAIGNRSRAGAAIGAPPSFSIGKAATASADKENNILDDSTVEPAHLMQYRNYQSTLRAAAQGAATPEMIKAAYARLPISILRHLEAA